MKKIKLVILVVKPAVTSFHVAPTLHISESVSVSACF